MVVTKKGVEQTVKKLIAGAGKRVRGGAKWAFDHYWMVFGLIMSITVIAMIAVARFKHDFSFDPENLRYAYSSLFQGLAALAGIVLVFLTLAHHQGSKALEEASTALRRGLNMIPGGTDFDSDPIDWKAIERWLKDKWCEKHLYPEARAFDKKLTAYKEKGSSDFPNLSNVKLHDLDELNRFKAKHAEVQHVRDGYYQVGVMLGKRSHELGKMDVVSWNTLLIIAWFIGLMLASMLLIFSINDNIEPPFFQTEIAVLLIGLIIAAVVHFTLYADCMVRMLLEMPSDSDHFSYMGLEKPEVADEILKRTHKEFEYRAIPWSVLVR